MARIEPKSKLSIHNIDIQFPINQFIVTEIKSPNLESESFDLVAMLYEK